MNVEVPERFHSHVILFNLALPQSRFTALDNQEILQIIEQFSVRMFVNDVLHIALILQYSNGLASRSAEERVLERHLSSTRQKTLMYNCRTSNASARASLSPFASFFGLTSTDCFRGQIALRKDDLVFSVPLSSLLEFLIL